MPDRPENLWKHWGESFSECSSEQTAWKDLVECVRLQMGDEEGQDCEQTLSLLGTHSGVKLCAPIAEHSLLPFCVMAY